MPKFESWRHGSTARRDERQAPRPETAHAKGGSSRNTKRWCRGKVGVEHALVVRKKAALGKSYYGWSKCIVRYCSRCGKELDYYWPPSDSWPKEMRDKRPAPDWIKECTD
jgi:hypothetical protein